MITLDGATQQQPSQALQRLQELDIQLLKLDRWEQDEISFNLDKIHKLLRQYHSSAALAVMKAALEISIKQGQ
jgi:hypothetical protein